MLREHYKLKDINLNDSFDNYIGDDEILKFLEILNSCWEMRVPRKNVSTWKFYVILFSTLVPISIFIILYINHIEFVVIIWSTFSFFSILVLIFIIPITLDFIFPGFLEATKRPKFTTVSKFLYRVHGLNLVKYTLEDYRLLKESFMNESLWYFISNNLSNDSLYENSRFY